MLLSSRSVRFPDLQIFVEIFRTNLQSPVCLEYGAAIKPASKRTPTWWPEITNSVNIWGRVVRKPASVNPGLSVSCSIIYYRLRMFFISNVWCSLILLQLKTAGQTI